MLAGVRNGKTRGVLPRGKPGCGGGVEQGLAKAPNLPPNFSGSKRQAGPGWGLGSGKMRLKVQGARALIGDEGPPVPLPGLEATGPKEGRGGLGSYVRSQEARSGRQKKERFPLMGIWGWGLGGDEDSFCYRRYL